MNAFAWTYAPLGKETIEGLRLLSFGKNRIIVDNHEFLLFEADCRYDVILGGDFLAKVGMNLDYKELEVEWLGNAIPIYGKPLRPNALATHIDSYLTQIKNDDFELEDSYKAQPILDAKYEKMDVEEVVDSCTHLSPKQWEELKALMLKHTKLFDDTLGKYSEKPNAHWAYRRRSSSDTNQFLG